MQPPLQLAAAVATVEASLWVRNGQCMSEQVLNYHSPPLCRHMSDLDLLVLQLGASQAGNAYTLNATFSAFGHLRLLRACIATLTADAVDSDNCDAEAERVCAALSLQRSVAHIFGSPFEVFATADAGGSRDGSSGGGGGSSVPGPLHRAIFGGGGGGGAGAGGDDDEELPNAGDAAASGGAFGDDEGNGRGGGEAEEAERVCGVFAWGAGPTQRAALLEDCLRLIMQLAVHLPRPAGEVHVVADMQSELTHMLLLRARTHSEMVEAMSSADEDPPRAELLQAAIDAVAVLQPGSPSTYSLRNGAIRDYVPTHPHLSRTDHQHVLQRQETLIRQERRDSDSASQLPPNGTPSEPAQRPPPPAHACFAAVRGLALSVPLLRLTRALCVHALLPPPPRLAGPMVQPPADLSRCLDKALQLLTLAMHVTTARSGSPGTSAAAAPGGEGESMCCNCAPREGSLAAGEALGRSVPAFWAALCWAPASSGGTALPCDGGDGVEPVGVDARAALQLSLLGALHALLLHSGGRAGAGFRDADGKLSAVSASNAQWMLYEAARHSPQCAAELERLTAALQGQRTSDGGQDSSRRQRRRHAQEAAMQRMAKQRAAFASAFASQLDDSLEVDGPHTGMPSPSASPHKPPLNGDTAMSDAGATPDGDRPLCIMCHGSHSPSRMVALSFAQLSSLRHSGLYAQPSGLDGATSSGPQRCVDDFHLQLCGHAMHLECWQRYLVAVSERRGGVQVLDPERRGLVLCPLCKSVSNVALPLLPLPLPPPLLPPQPERPRDDPSEPFEPAIAPSPQTPPSLPPPLRAPTLDETCTWLQKGLPAALERLHTQVHALVVPAGADPSQPRGDGWGVPEEPRTGEAVAPSVVPGSATTKDGAVSNSGGAGGAGGAAGASGAAGVDGAAAGSAAAGSAAAGGVAPGAACRIASPSSDLMGLSLGEEAAVAAAAQGRSAAAAAATAAAAAAAAAAATMQATEGWAAGLASALQGLRAAQQHSPNSMEAEPRAATTQPLAATTQLLASDLLPLYVSGWRAVALSFAVAAIEWRGAVGMSSEPWVPPSRATRESLGVQFRALQLRPELLHAALSLDTGADKRLELFSEKLAQLLQMLLSGDRLYQYQAVLLGRARPVAASAELLEAPAPTPTLLRCELAEVALLVLAALPAPSAVEVVCQLALLSLAALGQALLRACFSTDVCDEPPCTAWPHALESETEAAAALLADARSGLGNSAAPPLSPPPPPGAMSGAQREEASALGALRERLAVAARLRVHEAAPRGAALLCAVSVAMEHTSAMCDLLLHAVRPADFAPRAVPFSLGGGGGGGGGGGTPPSGLCSVTARDALRTEAALAVLERWAAACAPPVPLPRTLLAGGPAVLQLHVMPSDFSALTAQLHGRGCIYCHTPPLEPAVCLLCGALVCAGPNCRRHRAEGDKKEGECTRHARTCGTGTGMLYLAHQGMVLLMDGSRAACAPSRPAPSPPLAPPRPPRPPLAPSPSLAPSPPPPRTAYNTTSPRPATFGPAHSRTPGFISRRYQPSLYLDSHGEEDKGLRRGKPLYLSKPRVAALLRMWLTHSIPLEVARARASSSSVIRANFY